MTKIYMYPSKIEELAPDEAYYALVNETYRSDDGDGSYTSTNYIDIIHLGNKEQALGWLQLEEVNRERSHYPRNSFKIVIMKPCAVQRTVTLTI